MRTLGTYNQYKLQKRFMIFDIKYHELFSHPSIWFIYFGLGRPTACVYQFIGYDTE